jgi:hypothetical protein
VIAGAARGKAKKLRRKNPLPLDPTRPLRRDRAESTAKLFTLSQRRFPAASGKLRRPAAELT